MAVAPLRLTTSTGTRLLAVELLPSWPKEFSPQHLTLPPLVSAQVCRPLAAIAMTPLLNPLTSTGTRDQKLFAAESVPSWPSAFRPQHLPRPDPTIARVWRPPAAIATTPLASPST